MPQISTPLFRTDGAEKLQTADVYSLTNAIPVNKLYEAAKDIGGKLFDMAGGREGLVNSVTRLLTMQNAQMTGKEKLESVLQVFGSSTSSLLKTGSSGVLDKAGEYIGLDPSVINKVKVTIDNVSRDYVSSDSYKLNELLGLSSTMAGALGYENAVSIINIGLEASVWGATISSAIDNKSSNLVSYYSKNLDEEVKRLALMYASTTVMSSGDLDSLVAVLENTTPDVLLAQNTDFVRVFLMAFHMGDDWTADQYPEKGQLLFDTLKRLDANWYRYNRNGDWVINLAPLANMSEDAKTLLYYATEVGDGDYILRNAIQMAVNFPESTAQAICKAMYPLSVATLK